MSTLDNRPIQSIYVPVVITIPSDIHVASQDVNAPCVMPNEVREISATRDTSTLITSDGDGSLICAKQLVTGPSDVSFSEDIIPRNEVCVVHVPLVPFLASDLHIAPIIIVDELAVVQPNSTTCGHPTTNK